MLSVLVANSYFVRFDHKQQQRARPYPPLATLQVAASLRSRGHEVTVFDAMLADTTAEYDTRLHAARPQLALFYEDNFNYLSKMCLGRMRSATCEMIASARRAGARVVVGGSDASDEPRAYLAAGADIVLIGEGLSALRIVVERLNTDPQMPVGKLVEGLTGIAFADDAQTNVARGSAHQPDQQHPERPAWDLVDVEKYRAVWTRAHGYFSLNMAASRGCSFRCTWCAKPIWGNRYLQRSAEDVAEEMTYLKRTLRPDHIWFADDIFGFRVDWLQEFARALAREDGAIPFTIQTRADLISPAMAAALREAGCVEAWLGAESGSQRILDSMNKGTSVAELLTARQRLEAEGVRVGFFIQLGYLDEQLEDILATRSLIERARPDAIGVSVSYPLPGTKFYELVREQLRAKTHWDESDDLEMMFEGTYSSDFYRAIRDLLHAQISTQRLNGADYGQARASLEQRWDALLAEEHRYRKRSAGVAAINS